MSYAGNFKHFFPLQMSVVLQYFLYFFTGRISAPQLLNHLQIERFSPLKWY